MAKRKVITVDVLRHYLKCCDAGDVPDYGRALYEYLRMDGYIPEPKSGTRP